MNFTEEDREQVKRVMNDLLAHEFVAAIQADFFNEETGYYEDLDDNLSFWENKHRDLLDKYGITIANGVTKVCLIFDDNHDWVVKFDAIDFENEEEYCKLEEQHYREAVNENLGVYFAEEIFVDSFPIDEDESIDVYVQEYAEPDYDRIERILCDYAAEYYGDATEEVYEDADRLEAIFDDSDLIDFCFKHHINDLHEANYGIKSDGQIVIIDYSGY